MNVPPTKKPEKAPWRMQIGPIDVKDATLTIGFTKKPVVFHVDSAKITVQRRDEDPGPVIYIHEVQGHMMKPKPLPKPVRIAWANGLVNLVGEPLVHINGGPGCKDPEASPTPKAPKRAPAKSNSGY